MKKVHTYEHPVAAFYGEQLSTISSGKAISVPPGVHEVSVYDGSKAFRLNVGPPIAAAKVTADDSVTFTDYTVNIKDKGTATAMAVDALNTAANGDYIYVASKYPFGGITVDVLSANGTANSTLTGKYWNGTWVDASITDGTADTDSATFAADGVITWTPSSAWITRTLEDEDGLYVMQFSVAAQLDTACSLAGMALHHDEAVNPSGYFEASTVYTFSIDPEKTGSLVAWNTETESTLNITWHKHDYKNAF